MVNIAELFNLARENVVLTIEKKEYDFSVRYVFPYCIMRVHK